MKNKISLFYWTKKYPKIYQETCRIYLDEYKDQIQQRDEFLSKYREFKDLCDSLLYCSQIGLKKV